MRIHLITLLVVGMSSNAFSQITDNPFIRPILPISSLQDTNIIKLKDYLKKSQLPYNGMPNAITTKPLPPVYKGNNGKGFDIYESKVDNMPMLVPDSSNTYHMPGSKMTEKGSGIAPAYTLPRDLLNELQERQKAKDSLFMKPIQPKTFRYPKK